MSSDMVLGLMYRMLSFAMILAGPLLVVVLVVGLLISLLQVTTQIQEITLSFVPKIIATGVVMMILGPWMLGQLLEFSRTIYSIIPNIS